MTRQFLRQRVGRQVLIRGTKTDIYSAGGDHILYTDVSVYDVNFDTHFRSECQNYSHLYLPRYFKLDDQQVAFANAIEYKRSNGTVDYSVEEAKGASEQLIGEIKLTVFLIIQVANYSTKNNHTKLNKPLREMIAGRISYLFGQLARPIHKYSLEALPGHYRKELLPFLNEVLDSCMRVPKVRKKKQVKTKVGFAKI